MDNDNLEMNEAIFKAWRKMVITPTDRLVKLLLLETEIETKKKPTYEQVSEFIRLKVGLSNEKHQLPNTRTISNVPICVGVRDWGIYKGVKPNWFKMGEHKESVRNWRDLLVKVCTFVAEDNPSEFYIVLNYISGNRRSYFSKSDDSMKDGRKIPNTDIYVESNLSANNIKNLCDAIAKLFGYGKEIQVDTE